MNTPRLIRHGEHINPAYAGANTFRADDAGRAAGMAGVLRQYTKRQSASQRPVALGWIKALYPDAIEYTSKTKSLRGMGFATAWIFGVMNMCMGIWALYGAFHFGAVFTWVLFPPLAIIVFSIGLWIMALGHRTDLFNLSDQPIIFDRKHRRVYRLFGEIPEGRLRLFKRWPVRVCAYDWDAIEVEHHYEGMVTGATYASNHRLMFLVRKSPKDSTVIECFQVGNPMDLNEDLTAGMWEHIRRFMEEDGPHLPSPHEPLANQEPPMSWWESLGGTSMIGPGYVRRWKEQWGHMLLMHLGAPLTIPIVLLWATGNWLSYKTEVKVDWPDEVKRAVGAPIQSPVQSAESVVAQQ